MSGCVGAGNWKSCQGLNCWLRSPGNITWMWGFLSQFPKIFSCSFIFHLLGDFLSCIFSLLPFSVCVCVCVCWCVALGQTQGPVHATKHSDSELISISNHVFKYFIFFSFLLSVSKVLRLFVVWLSHCCAAFSIKDVPQFLADISYTSGRRKGVYLCLCFSVYCDQAGLLHWEIIDIGVRFFFFHP